MKRQFLMPSALGIVLMLCLLTVQASILRGTSQSVTGGMQSTQTDYTYGVPTLVRIVDTETRGGPPMRKVIVGWDRIIASIIVGWCLCMPIGRWITGYEKRNGEFAGPLRTGWAQPAAIVAYVIGSCVIASVATCAILDRIIGSPVSLAEMIFGFVILLMMVAVPVTVIAMIVRRWRYRMRIAQRGFAVEMKGASV